MAYIPENNWGDVLKWEKARIATYYRWTTNLDKVEELAKSGLFLVHPLGTTTQCIYCHGYINLSEIPEACTGVHTYHKLRFPTCPFVNGKDVKNEIWEDTRMRGVQPIQKIMAALEYMGEVQVDRATRVQKIVSVQKPQPFAYQVYGNGMLPLPHGPPRQYVWNSRIGWQQRVKSPPPPAKIQKKYPRPARKKKQGTSIVIKIGSAIIIPLVVMLIAQLITGAIASSTGSADAAKTEVEETSEEVGTSLEFPRYNVVAEAEMTGVILEEPNFQDTNELAPGIYQLEPWKGLVAVKKMDIIVPEKYVSATWKFDVQTCIEARDKLLVALAGVITNLPGDAQAKIAPTARVDLIRNQIGELSNIHMISGMKPIPAVSVMARVGNNAIMNTRECGIIQAAAEATARTTAEFASENGAVLVDITINELAGLASRLRQIVQVFRETMLKADSNELSPELFRLFSDTPSYLGRRCGMGEKPEDVLNNPAMFALIEGIDFSAEDDENITGNVASYVHTQVPCLKWENVYTKFELMAFPYGDQQPRILGLAGPEIWVNAQTGKIVDLQVMCKYYAPLAVCRKLHSEIQKETILGNMPNEINLATQVLGVKDNTGMIVEIKPSEYLIYTARPTEGQLRCGNTKTAIPFQGLIHAVIKKACRLDIKSMQAKLEGVSAMIEPLIPLVRKTFRSIVTITGGRNDHRGATGIVQNIGQAEEIGTNVMPRKSQRVTTERGLEEMLNDAADTATTVKTGVATIFQTRRYLTVQDKEEAIGGFLNAQNETIRVVKEHFQEHWPTYVITGTSITGLVTLCGCAVLIARKCRGRLTRKQKRKMYVRAGNR